MNVSGLPAGTYTLVAEARYTATGLFAVGYFEIDTRNLSNGVHTIAWVVFDDRGGGQGIGSRYFTVKNQ